jgi:hypothetical protein
MKKTYILLLTVVGLAQFLLVPQASAQISLGTAQNFGVLAGSTVTNTGATTVNGNVGVSPQSAVTGFPPGVIVGGAIHSNDAVAQQAQNDLGVAYTNIANTPCTVDLTGQNLGGLTLTPGVYCFSSSAQLTGALTLDALGNANALFLFKIGTTLTTASNSSVTIINNGGNSCNKVYWQVGTSATLGTGTLFVGDILAQASITLTTGSNTNGRTLARDGAVTLDTNNVNTCGVSVCPIITVNPATLPNGAVGTAYNQTVTASGGSPLYTFSISSGSLPAGLSLSSTGAITGSPTTAGTSTFTITARDANGCTGSRLYSITIAGAGCPVITVTPTTLPPAILLFPYTQTITATGGTTPYTFTIAAGALPSGLTLVPSGTISGSPQQTGVFNVTIRATDAAGCQGSRAYSLAILPGIPPAGGPTLSFVGLMILTVLLAAAGLFVMNRLSI